MVATLLWAWCACSAWGYEISAPAGLTAAQAPMTAEAFGRFDTDTVDSDTLDALALAAPLTLNLRATGNSVQLAYVGTSAARNANLFLAFAGPTADLNNSSLSASVPTASNTLFETRESCSYSQALTDPDCLITSIGTSRTITGLQAGDALVLGLWAQAQALPPTSELRDSASLLLAGPAGAGLKPAAHTLNLPDGRLLIGFEEGSDADFNDMVFVLQGASPVPEPGSPELWASGLLAMVVYKRLWSRRKRQR